MSSISPVFDSDDIVLSDEPRELRIGETIRCLRSGEIRERGSDE